MAAVDPFLRGRIVSEIEDIWHAAYVSSYWRSGPVLNNALSGVDMALYDIKGKLAGMPVVNLLGGKCRKAAPIYVHAGGNTFEEIAEDVQGYIDQGFTHIRVQQSMYGGVAKSQPRPPPRPFKHSSDGPTTQDAVFDAHKYCQELPRLFKYLRQKFGDDVELLHDVHERLSCVQAVQLCRAVEPYHPFFMGTCVAHLASVGPVACC